MQVFLSSGGRRTLFARDVHLYEVCDRLTAGLIFFMLVFSPWAFGTTQEWSIATMNLCGYALGGLLGFKLLIRRLKGYTPAGGAGGGGSPFGRYDWPTSAFLTHALAALTVAILLYCLIAALNARARFNTLSNELQYRACLTWLPHSLDSRSTWQVFWRLLALGCAFWATCDWLNGSSAFERNVRQQSPEVAEADGILPTRLKQLLFVVVLSGGLLAAEGIVQRLAHSPKLLFLIQPEIHQSAETQFASFAYRGNGAQYFNLLWPVGFGFWWAYRRSRNSTALCSGLLLACTIVMAAGPIISSARGGALAAVAMLTMLTFSFLASARSRILDNRATKRTSIVLLLLFLFCSIGLGAALGWKNLAPRFDDLGSALRDRNELCEQAQLIARDYPFYGTGPGTFECVFGLYRSSADAYWPSQLHNDWLELRITFGWGGSVLVLLALLLVVVSCFVRGARQSDRGLVFCLALAMLGCLVQARWDFPLQVYAIQFLFTAWCAALFSSPFRSGTL
ncbi:MAG TPA: O-antigen ligase family protein [Patescibacteria group bacterium]|nr:O-antigen ligase family protein [Patescibacteria group bacterium]